MSDANAGATSPFRFRGVIEGFYGPPWTHAERLGMIDFIAARGMNTFMYAPKDDPYVREQWRAPYTGEDLTRFEELQARSRGQRVSFVPCLSPGLSMQYSDPVDRELLIAKFATMVERGVTSVGLLLDDIPLRLQHRADQDAYASLVEAHIDLIGAVFAALPSGTGLFICPTQYYGRGDEAYVRELGRGIDPRIEVFWTGREICSPALDLTDAAAITRTLARPVTYWDNYPVNDVAMTHELHVGPYQGRDPDLGRFAAGIIVNAMEYFESSKIAIATVADYLNDPGGYDPERSWEDAIVDVAGDHAGDYRLFADNVRSSCLAPTDAPAITEALEDFMFECDYGQAGRAQERFGAVLDTHAGAARRLLAGAAGHPLLAEARPWLESYAVGIGALGLIAETAMTPNPEQLHALRDYRTQMRGVGKRVFGDVLDMTLTDLTAALDAPPPPIAR